MELLVLFVLIGGVYLFPTIIAAGREKRNAGAIFALNLLLGWTFLGWVVALVWAITVDTPTGQGNASQDGVDARQVQ